MKDKAFEMIFREYNRMVTAYLLSLVGDGDRALDLTQEVFLLAYTKMMDEYDPTRSIGAWLRAIARNLARNALRRERRHRLVLLDGGDIDRLFSVFDRAQPDLIWEERLASLDPCIAALPDRQREVVDRFYRGHQPARAIAQVIGILEKSVFQLMWHARSNLRRCIESTRNATRATHGA